MSLKRAIALDGDLKDETPDPPRVETSEEIFERGRQAALAELKAIGSVPTYFYGSTGPMPSISVSYQTAYVGTYQVAMTAIPVVGGDY